MSRYLLILLLSCSGGALSSQQYSYHALAVGNVEKWNIVRYQVETGRAWYVGKGGFVEIMDVEAQPISIYEFSVTNTVDAKTSALKLDFNWQLIRINTKTGETWWASKDKWIKVNENGSSSP